MVCTGTVPLSEMGLPIYFLEDICTLCIRSVYIATRCTIVVQLMYDVQLLKHTGHPPKYEGRVLCTHPRPLHANTIVVVVFCMYMYSKYVCVCVKGVRPKNAMRTALTCKQGFRGMLRANVCTRGPPSIQDVFPVVDSPHA